MLKQDTGQIRISETQPDFSHNGRVEVRGKRGKLGFSSGWVGGGDACATHTLEMVGAAYISFGSTCSILVMFLVTLIICSEMMNFVINKWVLDLSEYSFQH